MKAYLKGALIAVTLAAAPVLASAPSHAATDFSISLGNVAFGYNDGYWDRDHHWHAWHRGERNWWQAHHADHYYAARHDHDRHTMGWREEHWW